MKMLKLYPVDVLKNGDLLKLKCNHKAVPVVYCIGMKVGDIDTYMEDDFEGFFRPTEETGECK